MAVSSGPLINMLKWFLLKIRFRGDICEISDSLQTNTARSFGGTNFFLALIENFFLKIYENYLNIA